MLEIQIILLLGLLNMDRLLTGEVKAWQKGILFAIASCTGATMFALGVIATHGLDMGIWSYLLYVILTTVSSIAYFHFMDKAPGIFDMPVKILGGILLLAITDVDIFFEMI